MAGSEDMVCAKLGRPRAKVMQHAVDTFSRTMRGLTTRKTAAKDRGRDVWRPRRRCATPCIVHALVRRELTLLTTEL